MKLVLNAWLISMMQGIAESAQLAKTLGFTPTSCGAPWKAARWRRLCQSETGRHRQRAVYPADAAGACPERCPAGAFPGRAAHHAGAGKHRRTVAAGGGRGICRRGFVCGISVAVAVVKSVVSYPRQERSGHGGHLSWRMGINSNLPYVSLSYQSIRSGADSAGDNSVPTPPAASGR